MNDRIHIEAARAALARAAWVRGETPSYNEDAISDLLADLRHLCSEAGLDYSRCDRVAGMYFQEKARGRVMTRPLTEVDKREGLIRATGGFSGAKQRWAERAASGLTDEALAEALTFELGILGGSSGPDRLSLTFQGSGLKIWISWEVHNHMSMKPTFESKSTTAMARLVYGIKDPSDRQLTLL